MAEAEDLVALILSALGAASASELHILSELLASESSLQLQRLWLLVGSPSRCLAIISFLDSLSQNHRRLLIARVTLHLVCRITDFLEDPAQQAFESSVASPAHTDMAHNLSQAESLSSSESLNSLLNGEDGPVGAKNTTVIAADGTAHFQRSSTTSESDLQTILHRKNQRPTCGFVADVSRCSDEAESMHMTGAESLAKPEVKIVNPEHEGHSFANSSSPNPLLDTFDPVNNSLACTNFAMEDRRNPLVQSSNARIASLDSVSPLVAHMHSWASSPFSGPDLRLDMASTSCEDEMDILSLPWGETDAAFLFLFLWETQEQECQEAMERWCIDPSVYHLFIVQDMAVLVDDEKKAGCIRAPRWRDRLQQYLQQNILQVGYGFPGIMASPNLPPSLSIYIDTIGKFQRILEAMEAEDDSEQKLPAASAAAMHSLPTTVIGLCSEDKGKVCIICKEELEPLSIASQLPCMHVYHWDCILSWLKQRNNCPVCRHELPSDDYDHELRKKIQMLTERAV